MTASGDLVPVTTVKTRLKQQARSSRVRQGVNKRLAADVLFYRRNRSTRLEPDNNQSGNGAYDIAVAVLYDWGRKGSGPSHSSKISSQ